MKQSTSKRNKLREGDCKQVDYIVFRCFIPKRSQNISTDGVLITEKPLQYANGNLSPVEYSTENIQRIQEREICIAKQKTS